MQMNNCASAAILVAGALVSACASMGDTRPASAGGYETQPLPDPSPPDLRAISSAASAPGPSASEPPAPPPAPVVAAQASPPAAPIPPAAAIPPSAPPPPSAEEAAAAVRSALQAWAAAWSARDMTAYVLAYDPAFTGRFKTHAQWIQDRREHIASRRTIAVEVSDLQVTASGPTARATFVQHYVSDKLKQTNRKSLAFRLDGQRRWVIVKEIAEP